LQGFFYFIFTAWSCRDWQRQLRFWRLNRQFFQPDDEWFPSNHVLNHITSNFIPLQFPNFIPLPSFTTYNVSFQFLLLSRINMPKDQMCQNPWLNLASIHCCSLWRHLLIRMPTHIGHTYAPDSNSALQNPINESINQSITSFNASIHRSISHLQNEVNCMQPPNLVVRVTN
jgi:hypothetical protein